MENTTHLLGIENLETDVLKQYLENFQVEQAAKVFRNIMRTTDETKREEVVEEVSEVVQDFLGDLQDKLYSDWENVKDFTFKAKVKKNEEHSKSPDNEITELIKDFDKVSELVTNGLNTLVINIQDELEDVAKDYGYSIAQYFEVK